MSLASSLASGSWHHLTEAVLHRLSGADGRYLALFWDSFLLAACVTYAKTTPKPKLVRGFVLHVLPPAVLKHRSARADFLFWLSRRITMPLLIVPLSLSTAGAGYAVVRLLEMALGPRVPPAASAGPVMLAAFAVTMLLAYDISYYIYHYLQHRIPLLWELHKVHHSAEVMVGVTKDRVHPLDDLMNHWWDGLIPGAVYGMWVYFAMDPAQVTLFGINVFVLRNILMMDFVRHTHMKLSFGKWLNTIILCPHYHQLHHSVDPKHYDKNFGLLLSVWDRLFGTLAIPEKDEDFRFGLAHAEHTEYQSVLRLYALPLKKMWLMLTRSPPMQSLRPLTNSRTTVMASPEARRGYDRQDGDRRGSAAAARGGAALAGSLGPHRR